MSLSPVAVLKSLSYYTGLIFGAEGFPAPVLRLLPAVGLSAILVYCFVRRSPSVLFALSSYVLTLLPVSTLPNIRSPLYLYGPQIFLLAVVCIMAQETVGAVSKRGGIRWAFALTMALALITSAALFRRGAYFRDRIAFSRAVRTTAGRTARDAAAQLSHIGSNAHVYLNHGQETPWLFTAEPCAFLRLMNQRPVVCIWHKPEDELRKLYVRDHAEKYFLDYFADGSLKVRSEDNAQP